MGLDLVELTVAVEESFGVKIPDEDAQRLQTPRAWIDYLRRRLPADGRGGCLSQRAFSELRQALRTLGVADADRLRPDTPLADLLVSRRRRFLWQELGRELGVPLPELRRGLVLLVGGWLGIGAMAVWVWARAGWLAASAIAPLALGAFLALTTSGRTHLPLRSVGDLVSFLVLHHSRRFAHPRGSFTPEQIRGVVCGLIARTFGTTQFSLDSRLVRLAESRG